MASHVIRGPLIPIAPPLKSGERQMQMPLTPLQKRFNFRKSHTVPQQNGPFRISLHKPQGVPCLFGRSSGQFHDHPFRARLKLLVADAHVHHAPTIDMPQTRHQRGGKQVQRDFLRRPGGHTRRTRQNLGSRRNTDPEFRFPQQARLRIATHTDRQGSDFPSKLNNGACIRRVAAGCDADHHVLRSRVIVHQIKPCLIFPVFRTFRRLCRRPCPTSEQQNQLLRRHTKVGVSSTPSCNPIRPDVPAPA